MRHFILPSSSPLAMRAGTCSLVASARICSAVGGGRGARGRLNPPPGRAPMPGPDGRTLEGPGRGTTGASTAACGASGGVGGGLNARAGRAPMPGPDGRTLEGPGRGTTGASTAACGASVGVGATGGRGEGTGRGVGPGVGTGATAAGAVGRGLGRGFTVAVWVGVGAPVPGAAAGPRMTSTARATRRAVRSFTTVGYPMGERPGGGPCSRLLEGLRQIYLPSGRLADHLDLFCHTRGNHAHLRLVPLLTRQSDLGNIRWRRNIREKEGNGVRLHGAGGGVGGRLGLGLEGVLGGLGERGVGGLLVAALHGAQEGLVGLHRGLVAGPVATSEGWHGQQEQGEGERQAHDLLM